MITPTRVVVDSDGYAVPPSKAKAGYGIEPDIVFEREDGWSLGAPSKYENLAYMAWEGEWVSFQRKEDKEPQHISEYHYQPS